MKKNKTILSADTELMDNEARKQLSMLWTKIETINERTKNIMSYIREIDKKIKLEGIKK